MVQWDVSIVLGSILLLTVPEELRHIHQPVDSDIYFIFDLEKEWITLILHECKYHIHQNECGLTLFTKEQMERFSQDIGRIDNTGP